MGSELRGKTLGLVGCGNVGRLIAHKLSTWELKEVIGYDPFLTNEQLAAVGIRKCELKEVLAHGDIVSLHLPLTPETKHSIKAEEIGLMKQGAILVNAARGGIVDEEALAAALANNRLAGAVADVFEHEPVVPQALLNAPHMLLTPHIAGFTHEADKEVSSAPVREFLRLIDVV
jgi:D-3-phosphoglycerate dehydrogenase